MYKFLLFFMFLAGLFYTVIHVSLFIIICYNNYKFNIDKITNRKNAKFGVKTGCQYRRDRKAAVLSLEGRVDWLQLFNNYPQIAEFRKVSEHLACWVGDALCLVVFPFLSVPSCSLCMTSRVASLATLPVGSSWAPGALVQPSPRECDHNSMM